MNNSRVLPARLIGSRLTGGSVELVLLRDLGGRLLGMPEPSGQKDEARH